MNDKPDNGGFIALILFSCIGLYLYSKYSIDAFKFWLTCQVYFYEYILKIPEGIRQYAFLYTDTAHYIAKLFGFKVSAIDVYGNAPKAYEALTTRPIKELFEDIKLIAYIDKMTFYVLSPLYVLFTYMLVRAIINKRFLDRTFSMQTLAESQANTWKESLSMVFDIESAITVNSPKEGWFRQAKKPFDCATENDLFDFWKNTDKESEFYDQLKYSLDLQKTQAYFSGQLGRKFEGFDKLNIVEKCLMCVIVSKIIDSKEVHTEFMEQANEAYSSIKKIKKTGWFRKNRTVIDKSHEASVLAKRVKFHKKVEDYIQNKIMKSKDDSIQVVLKSHYYVYTVFMRMLSVAREGGVLAGAAMLWVKREDQHLHFVISQTGRKASFCEVSGVYSHYLVEESMQQSLAEPQIAEAITGLDKYLKEHFKNYESKIS